MEQREQITIGIYFPDNDFQKTITHFLEVLAMGINNHHCRNTTLKERYTKERIVLMFNSMAHGLYLATQNGFCYDGDLIDKYLTISPASVFIDDEVDEALRESDWNGEFHYATFSEGSDECEWITT